MALARAMEAVVSEGAVGTVWAMGTAGERGAADVAVAAAAISQLSDSTHLLSKYFYSVGAAQPQLTTATRPTRRADMALVSAPASALTTHTSDLTVRRRQRRRQRRRYRHCHRATPSGVVPIWRPPSALLLLLLPSSPP